MVRSEGKLKLRFVKAGDVALSVKDARPALPVSARSVN